MNELWELFSCAFQKYLKCFKRSYDAASASCKISILQKSFEYIFEILSGRQNIFKYKLILIIFLFQHKIYTQKTKGNNMFVHLIYSNKSNSYKRRSLRSPGVAGGGWGSPTDFKWGIWSWERLRSAIFSKSINQTSSNTQNIFY